MITFGENILLWRRYRALSQEELAARSGVPRPNISDIEKNKRDVTLSTIRSLANALNVLPGTLVNGETPYHKTVKRDLSREVMEKVASSVAQGKSPRNAEERQLYKLLREILRSSLMGAHSSSGRLPQPTAKSKLAWLQLRVLYPPEVINSLIARTREHAERI